MITKKLRKEIKNSLQIFPVVGLIGSRQAGKTTLAKSFLRELPDSIYIDLELPSDMNKLQNAEF